MHVLQRYRKRNNKVASIQDDFESRATREFEEYISNAPNKVKFSVVDKNFEDEGTIIDLSVVHKEKQGDEKALLTRKDTKLKVGYTVKFQEDSQFENMWLIHSLESRPVNSHKRFNIREINYSVDFKVNNEIFRVPCLCANGSQFYTGQEITDKITVGNKILTLSIGTGLDGSKKIFKGLRFLNNINGTWEAFKITSIADTILGQLTVQAIEDRIMEEDDKVNGLAYNEEFVLDQNKIPMNHKILGDDNININSINEKYIVESNPKSDMKFTFEIDNPEFAEIKNINNKMCILNPRVANEYVTLIAKSGDIEIRKNIFIKGGW